MNIAGVHLSEYSRINFQGIKYYSFPVGDIINLSDILKDFEIKNVDTEFKKVIENAPLLKKLGAETDVFVCHYKDREKNHNLYVDFIDEKPPFDAGIGIPFLESFEFGKKCYSDNDFYNFVKKVFDKLSENYNLYKKDPKMDIVRIKDPQTIICFNHKGKIRLQGG